MLNEFGNHPHFVRHMISTYKAVFKINRHFNKHSTVLCDQNLNIIIQTKLNPSCLCIWGMFLGGATWIIHFLWYCGWK
jgi:hypothetical protein